MSRLKCGLGMLQRSRTHLTTRAKKLLYYGQVHSHLCYGIGVWGPMISKGQLNDLRNIQMKCLKLVNPSIPTNRVLSQLKVLNIEKLIDLEQCKLGYKLCHQMLPVVLTKLIKQDQNNTDLTKTHPYPTRQKAIPHRPNAKLGLYRNSFLYKTISCYSNLPSELQTQTRYRLFANQCKNYLLSNKV